MPIGCNGYVRKLRGLLEKSLDLLATEGGKPVLFFKPHVPIVDNAVDLSGVDAEGTIVLVECKLEANHEASRIVIGQIVEHPGQLRSVGFQDFEEMLSADSGLSLEIMHNSHATRSEDEEEIS